MAIGAYTTALLTTRFAVTYALALPAGVVRDDAAGREPRLSGAAAVRPLSRPGDARFPRSGFDRHRGISRSHRRRARPETGDTRTRGLAAERPTRLYYFVLGVTALAICAGWNIQRSRYGRAFDAVRQSVDRGAGAGHLARRAPSSSRFPSPPHSLDLAGGLFTAVVGFIDPTEFDISASLREITFIVVGGLGSVLGSVVGAVVLTLLPETLRGAKEYSDVVYGVILLGALLLAPKGIVGSLASLLAARIPAARRGCHEPSCARQRLGQLRRRRRGARRHHARRGRRNPRPDRAERRRQNVADQFDHRDRPAGAAAPSPSAMQEITALAPDVIAARGIGRTFQHVELFRDSHRAR